jgi:hypothetical protein
MRLQQHGTVVACSFSTVPAEAALSLLCQHSVTGVSVVRNVTSTALEGTCILGDSATSRASCSSKYSQQGTAAEGGIAAALREPCGRIECTQVQFKRVTCWCHVLQGPPWHISSYELVCQFYLASLSSL